MRQCTFPPCERPAHSKGLCQSHYMQRWLGKALSPLRPAPTRYGPDARCQFAGCKNHARSRGLCGGHAYQRDNGIALRPLKHKNKGKPCKFNGCTKPARGLGYCAGHYTQARKGQKPVELKPPPSGMTLRVGSLGYVDAYLYPDHPLYQYAKDAGVPMRRDLHHRLVMAERVGRRLLSTETVHHKDGNRANNSLDNLELRHGNHGQGQKIVCADCGSHNVVATSLAARP